MVACITEFHQRHGSVVNGWNFNFESTLFDEKYGMGMDNGWIEGYWNLLFLMGFFMTVVQRYLGQQCQGYSRYFEWSEISHKNNKVCLIDFIPLRDVRATVTKEDVVQHTTISMRPDDHSHCITFLYLPLKNMTEIRMRAEQWKPTSVLDNLTIQRCSAGAVTLQRQTCTERRKRIKGE